MTYWDRSHLFAKNAMEAHLSITRGAALHRSPALVSPLARSLLSLYLSVFLFLFVSFQFWKGPLKSHGLTCRLLPVPVGVFDLDRPKKLKQTPLDSPDLAPPKKLKQHNGPGTAVYANKIQSNITGRHSIAQGTNTLRTKMLNRILI